MLVKQQQILDRQEELRKEYARKQQEWLKKSHWGKYKVAYLVTSPIVVLFGMAILPALAMTF